MRLKRFNQINESNGNFPFGYNKIKEIASTVNADIVYDNPSMMLIKINDYNASKSLGSKHWGIVYQENMWNNYVHDFINCYFFYDFTKSENDKEALIGAMVNPDGKITQCYFADDTVCPPEYLDIKLEGEE